MTKKRPTTTPPPATALTRTLTAADYWKLRAAIGDVERADAALLGAQQAYMDATQHRLTLLQSAAGLDIDLKQVTGVGWNDPALSVTFHVKPSPPGGKS